jgi:translation initiation factor IF-3
MPTSRAKALAEEASLDLVELGMQEGIPLTKVIDYGKHLFNISKKQIGNKQNAKKTDVKTIKLTYKIAEHDMEVRKNQAEKFAKDGHPLRITLQLKGRENQYSDLAIAKIQEFVASLADSYKHDPANKMSQQGTTYTLTLYPKK